MADIGKSIGAFLLGKLQGDAGINSLLNTRRAFDRYTPPNIRSFSPRNVAAELMEKSNQAQYPAALVYCEKLENTLEEKFRTFSGRAKLVIEIRNSEDRLEAMDGTLVYADLACAMLGNLQGEWLPGMFYDGGYEVVYSPVKGGGKHFLQSAKISLEIDISE